MSDWGDRFTNDCNTSLVCELFASDRNSRLFKHLRDRAESPLQVPFYYLDLIRGGQVDTMPPAGDGPSIEQVKLAYQAILQRAPENSSIIARQIEACATVHDLIVGLLTSHEVILRLPHLHARAFPGAHRIWHLHIPKTGGTSFFGTAGRVGCNFVNTNMLSGALGDLSKIANSLRLVGQGNSRTVVISGHWRLPQYRDAIAPFDKVVVFVRDPVQRLVSEFNYAVDVVRGNSNVHASDPQLFLSRGLDPKSFTNTLQSGFFSSNLQCSFLASEATCEAALNACVSCDAEVLPSSAVNHAVSRFFPGAENRRANVSHKHLTAVEITSDVYESILAANSHDFALFQIAQSRFEASHRGPATAQAVPAPHSEIHSAACGMTFLQQ